MLTFRHATRKLHPSSGSNDAKNTIQWNLTSVEKTQSIDCSTLPTPSKLWIISINRYQVTREISCEQGLNPGLVKHWMTVNCVPVRVEGCGLPVLLAACDRKPARQRENHAGFLVLASLFVLCRPIAVHKGLARWQWSLLPWRGCIPLEGSADLEALLSCTT